jgi:hypothetical protein
MTAEPFTLSSEPQPAKRKWLIPEPVELLIEHPLADRKWVLAKELPEPRWFLLCTTEGKTLAVALYLNRRQWPFTALNSWTGSRSAAFNSGTELHLNRRQPRFFEFAGPGQLAHTMSWYWRFLLTLQVSALSKQIQD